MEIHQSALMDHIGLCNHTMDWEKVRMLAQEPNQMRCGIREAIEIKKMAPHTINWDARCHNLSEIYTTLLQTVQLVQMYMCISIDNATRGCSETGCW